MKRRQSDEGIYRTPSKKRKIIRRVSTSSSGSSAMRDLAAGTLGFIVGDVPGAVTAYTASRNFFTQKKIEMKHTSEVNRQAMRASMSKRGSHKIKSIRGKQSKVKVSNKLREKIKKVVEEKKAPGTYIKSVQGTIGSCITSVVAGTFQTTINGIVNQIGVIPMYSDTAGLGGQQCCWFQAITPWGQANNLQNGWDMSFFTPAKIMDAASILWNGKPMAADPYQTTGNFTTQTSNAGLPQNQFRSNLHIKNAYVTFEFKNNGQRTMTLLVRHCVPKVKFCTQSPLQCFQSGVYVDTNISGNANGPLIPYPGSATDSFAQYMNDIDLPWTHVDNFKRNWKYETVKIVIAPGETCKHSIQGPKNMTVNFNDLYNGAGFQFYSYYKKTSLAVVIGVVPDLVYASSTGVRTNYTGRWVDFTNKDDPNYRNPISVEWKEHYDLAMPETTGFTSAVLAGGTTQSLNLRSKKYASYKYGDNIDEAAAVVTRYDEEQPATSINLG